MFQQLKVHIVMWSCLDVLVHYVTSCSLHVVMYLSVVLCSELVFWIFTFQTFEWCFWISSFFLHRPLQQLRRAKWTESSTHTKEYMDSSLACRTYTRVKKTSFQYYEPCLVTTQETWFQLPHTKVTRTEVF